MHQNQAAKPYSSFFQDVFSLDQAFTPYACGDELHAHKEGAIIDENDKRPKGSKQYLRPKRKAKEFGQYLGTHIPALLVCQAGNLGSC